MDDQVFTLRWPVHEVQEHGLYFYQKPTESYQSDSRVTVASHGQMIMLGSYSYLGLNTHPAINKAARQAIEQFGTGTYGVRLLAGTLDLHHSLEKRIARFKQTEEAVTFSSGYIANLSTISSLVGRGDTIICDKLNHASILDGCQLSQAKCVRFQHNDMQHLEHCLKDRSNRGRKLVVVDAVFSMDGDIINLPEVSGLCRRYGAVLMVDEAHSLGVLGNSGHGIEEHFGLAADSIDIKMGTFSKAIPSVGGYVAGSKRLCEILSHQARGFIYSAALPPAAAAAACAALDVIEQEPERVRRLHNNIDHFRASLRAQGFSFIDNASAIFPIMCGDNWRAWKLANYCQMRGVYLQAIPHPVVPKGTARLRASITSDHKREDLDYCAAVVREGASKLGILP